MMWGGRLKGYVRKIIQVLRTMHAHMPKLQVIVHAAAELPKMDNFKSVLTAGQRLKLDRD